MNATCRLLLGTLALGLATSLHGATNTVAVVYCKARLLPSGSDSGNVILSVSLPATEGYTDPYGNPVTIWNIGDVVAGGVADSWHNGGPGYFTAHNTGNVAAYVYVVALSGDYDFHDIYDGQGNPIGTINGLWETSEYLFGNFPSLSPRPTALADTGVAGFERSYHLALTTDINAKAPVWRSLDHAYTRDAYAWGDNYYNNSWQKDNGYWNCECSAYLGFMAVGDYQPFDLKFWAPPPGFLPGNIPVSFNFTVEASSFPRWDHDR